MFRNPMQAFFDKLENDIEMGRHLVFVALLANLVYLYVILFADSIAALTTNYIVVLS